MTQEPHQVPEHRLEDWTDAELLDQYRYVQAETEDLPIEERDDSPVDVLRQEILRRGLELDADLIEGDAASPGRASTDPHRREAR